MNDVPPYAAHPVDLTNCDQEPIHIPGSVQPHGAMLVVSGEEMVIRHASSNVGDVIGIVGGAFVGQPLEQVLGREQADAVRNASAKCLSPAAPGLVFGMPNATHAGKFDVAVHTYLGHTFVEFQPSATDTQDFGPLEFSRGAARRLADEKSVQALADTAAQIVAIMLEYDRVMVYKLLHNGAGRVIAEQRRPDLNSFLNQHFPASDIPAQARELYKRNWIRMISDASFTPRPVLPPVPQSAPPLDMSYCQLRSVSPIHCEYLRNMGVAASLSISIIVDDELWGLIACHHYSPKAVPLPLRVGAELFGQILSLQIESTERRERSEEAARARALLDEIVADLPPEQNLAESLSSNIRGLGGLLPCDGVGLWLEGVWHTTGTALPTALLPDLLEHLATNVSGGLWHSNRLAAQIPTLKYSVRDVAGVLAVPISRTPRDYLFYFRDEESRLVEWAGEPHKPIQAGPLGDRLTPRKSFELWREEVQEQSTPWTGADLVIAEAAQNYLRDVVLRHTEATADERQRADIRRKLVNEELNHRVKNILALAASLVSQSRRGAQSVDDLADALHGRIKALGVAHDQVTQDKRGGDLRKLINTELAAHEGPQSRHTLQGPQVFLQPQAFTGMALVIHELATNAAKYGSLASGAGTVDVAWTFTDAGDCELTWTERGGAPVKAPQRTGFGSTLVGKIVPADLGGSAEIDYRVEGVVARLAVPARHVIRGDGGMDAAPQRNSASVDLTGQTVLVVEDQALIALEAEEILTGFGASRIIIASSAAQALTHLSVTRPAVAMLDVNLGTTMSINVADELFRLGIPFVFATGYSDSALIPERLRHIPILRKPYGRAEAAMALSRVISKSG